MTPLVFPVLGRLIVVGQTTKYRVDPDLGRCPSIRFGYGDIVEVRYVICLSGMWNSSVLQPSPGLLTLGTAWVFVCRGGYRLRSVHTRDILRFLLLFCLSFSCYSILFIYLIMWCPLRVIGRHVSDIYTVSDVESHIEPHLSFPIPQSSPSHMHYIPNTDLINWQPSWRQSTCCRTPHYQYPTSLFLVLSTLCFCSPATSALPLPAWLEFHYLIHW